MIKSEKFGIEIVYSIETEISIGYLDNIISFMVPKNQIKSLSAEEHDEIDNYGIYFLVDIKSQNLYIGKTDNLLKRIREHSRSSEKTFDYVYAFTTKGNSMSQTYIDYLEHYFIKKLNDSEYWNLYNKDLRVKIPNLKPIEKVNLTKLIKNIDCLLSFLRITLKDKTRKIEKSNKIIEMEKPIEIQNELSGEVFTFKGAYFVYSSKGSFLLKNSVIKGSSKMEKTKVAEKYKQNLSNEIIKRKNLIESWILNNSIKKINSISDEYILINDIKLNSPSQAAQIVSGLYSADGWTAFKNREGKTLKEVYR
ncbi:MAG: GIY-YIG nuclease family protein [Mycoplasmoidaceae bacterium]